MTWRENFAAWWRFWGEGKGEGRDFERLDRIHPQRIKTLEELVLKIGYDPANVKAVKEMIKKKNVDIASLRK